MTLKDLNQKYEQLCIQIGDCKFKIRQYQKQIESLYTEVDKINHLAGLLVQNPEALKSQSPEALQPEESKETNE